MKKPKIYRDPKKAGKVKSVLEGVDIVVRLRNKFVPVVVRESDIEKAAKIVKENINEII